MPKQVTVTLGGREYTFHRKPYGVHLRARERIKSSSVYRVLESLDDFTRVFQAIVKSIPKDGSWRDIDFGQALGLMQIAPATIDALLNSVEEIVELLFEYEPKLKTERKWLEEHAYDEEFVNAFVAILKMLFPIMAAWAVVSGRAEQETSTNSPSPNGTSALPPGGPKKKDKNTTLPETTQT